MLGLNVLGLEAQRDSPGVPRRKRRELPAEATTSRWPGSFSTPTSPTPCPGTAPEPGRFRRRWTTSGPRRAACPARGEASRSWAAGSWPLTPTPPPPVWCRCCSRPWRTATPPDWRLSPWAAPAQAPELFYEERDAVYHLTVGLETPVRQSLLFRGNAFQVAVQGRFTHDDEENPRPPHPDRLPGDAPPPAFSS